MKYDIPYDHLEEELVTENTMYTLELSKLLFHFRKVKESANKYRLELSDEDFESFFRLHVSGVDIDWIMHIMSTYENSITDTLVQYITG
ncbi:hypothetical protein QJS65_10435 [Bacillus altitudinis]|uniref:hypothetical protein n=1 Tax=Bacillus altitudinis TaxID=293387 RepID=UPI0024A8325F|nr:hypothetical protein [Bacillus altitudinis]WHF25266.1 hypothetical protein QJS65_10435 [Bacillus altitudinis]